MTGSPAARLAEALRTVMKAQALDGAELAKEVERLTGTCPSPTWVSRRIGGAARSKPLLTVDDDLFVIAKVLGVEAPELARMVIEAVFGHYQPVPHDPDWESDVASWIKRHRDEHGELDTSYPSDWWRALDSLLDDYRAHADFGVPLDQEVPGPEEAEHADTPVVPPTAPGDRPVIDSLPAAPNGKE